MGIFDLPPPGTSINDWFREAQLESMQKMYQLDKRLDSLREMDNPSSLPRFRTDSPEKIDPIPKYDFPIPRSFDDMKNLLKSMRRDRRELDDLLRYSSKNNSPKLDYIPKSECTPLYHIPKSDRTPIIDIDHLSSFRDRGSRDLDDYPYLSPSFSRGSSSYSSSSSNDSDEESGSDSSDGSEKRAKAVAICSAIAYALLSLL